MLATAGDPPTGPDWAREFKWDGQRAIIVITGGRVRLFSRDGNDITSTYPELAALGELVDNWHDVVLDGEIVALGDGGLPDIGMLQHRMHVQSPNHGLLTRVPASFYVFDLLRLDRHPVWRETYRRRRQLLTALGLEGACRCVRVPPSYTGITGHDLLQVAREHGGEGVGAHRVAQHRQSQCAG